MAADRSAPLRVALYVTLGLVAAFVASAIAGMGEDRDAAGGRAAADPAAPRPADTPAHAEIRVEVLNGAGEAGLAREVTHQLRASGFDVVYFGNARRFDHARSVVFDRVGDPARARMVATSLAIDSIATLRDSTLLLDVSVVLGQDWGPSR